MKGYELIEVYIDANTESKNTKRNYNRILESFMDYINDLNILTFEKYIEWKKQISNRSINTQKQYITVTKGFVNWCFDNYNLGNASELLKITNIKSPRGNGKPTEPLESNQVRKMIDYSKNIRDKAIIALLASTGLRISELINIKIEDFSEGNILVKGKGNKYRWVYPNEEALKLIKEYVETMRAEKIKEKNINTNLLFISNNGSPMKSNVLNKTWKNIASRCGIDTNVHNHTFRHTMGNSMINQGVPLDSVQHILGHSDISTTQIYAVKSIKQIQKEIKNVNIF